MQSIPPAPPVAEFDSSPDESTVPKAPYQASPVSLPPARGSVWNLDHTLISTDVYEPILTHSHGCLLKRRENLTDHQAAKLKDLRHYNLKSVRAHLLQDLFQRIWEYVSPGRATKYLSVWCTWVLRGRLGLMKKVAPSLRSHRELILNWLRTRGTIVAGIAEGFNGKAKLPTTELFGLRAKQGIDIALYHTLGNLPEPEFNNGFC